MLGVSQCDNGIFFVARSKFHVLTIVNDDGKCWPTTQIFLDRSSRCAGELDMKTVQ